MQAGIHEWMIDEQGGIAYQLLSNIVQWSNDSKGAAQRGASFFEQF